MSKTQYYKTHYNWLGQLGAGSKYITSKLSGIIWGYGHRVSRLILSYLILTFVLSLITYFFKLQFFVADGNTQRKLFFWESISMGFSETVGASSISYVPTTFGGQLVTYSASLFGILFLALLAATLYRKIAR